MLLRRCLCQTEYARTTEAGQSAEVSLLATNALCVVGVKCHNYSLNVAILLAAILPAGTPILYDTLVFALSGAFATAQKAPVTAVPLRHRI